MLTIFWNPNGFHLVRVLPKGCTFNGDYFINAILDPIYQMTAPLREEYGRSIILHYDNAKPHNSSKVLKYLESHDMIKAPQPPFSPDIAPSDFYLFGYIKKVLEGQSFDSPEQLLQTVNQILDSIPSQELQDTFQNWQMRLNQVITNNGEYIE